MKTQRIFTGAGRRKTERGDSARVEAVPTPASTGTSLCELANDLLAAVLEFRAKPTTERPRYQDFSQEIRDFLGDFERRADRAGVDRNRDGMLALVALADESAMGAEWEGAKRWAANKLAVDYFKNANCGNEFFVRAEEVARGDNRDLMELYYTCLCAGFRGAMHNDPDGLRTIKARLYQRFVRVDPRDEQNLTPDAYGHRLERPFVLRRFPLYVAIPIVIATVGLYVAFHWTLSGQLSEIEQRTPALAAATEPS